MSMNKVQTMLCDFTCVVKESAQADYGESISVLELGI